MRNTSKDCNKLVFALADPEYIVFDVGANRLIDELRVQGQRKVCIPIIECSQSMPHAPKTPPGKHIVEEPVMVPTKNDQIHGNRQVWWFCRPHLINTHLQGFVNSRRIRFLPEDQFLAFEALDAVNSPARHEYCRIAGLHKNRVSVESNFHPAFDHTKILLVVLGVFVHFQYKRRAHRATTFTHLVPMWWNFESLFSCTNRVHYVSINRIIRLGFIDGYFDCLAL